MPTAEPLVLEVVAGSVWPDVLSEQGYKLHKTGSGERIINAAAESNVVNAKGEVTFRNTQPGRVPTEIFDLWLP